MIVTGYCTVWFAACLVYLVVINTDSLLQVLIVSES